MPLLERFEACRGLDVPGIAAALSDLEQDEITEELMTLFAQRTVPSALPRLPFVIRHTMYGDLDVSDWLIRYSESGFEVVAAEPDSASDAHLRWEHWEDAVRMLTGDAGEAGLFFTRRLSAPGDVPTGLLASRWTSSVDFTASGDLEERPGVLDDRLRTAAWAGEAELARFIEDRGLPRLLRARAMNMASSIADIGAGSDVAGSFMRLEIDANPRVGVHTEFPAGGGAAQTRVLAAEELGNEDFDKGVTLRWETVGDFVDAVTFRQEMGPQVASGSLRFFGSQDRLQAFAIAMNKLIDAMRPPRPK